VDETPVQLDPVNQPKPVHKRLRRSNDQRILLGVCGGLAEYFDIDPTIVRIIFVGAALLGLSGILIYIVLAVVMPSEQHLESDPRVAARSTFDEAVSEANRAVDRWTTWVRQKVKRS
jgi:phage shock protein PspC (stress-responsive transcriptional regulator)